MKRLLKSRAVDQALRGASLVVTDRRWAAPLSAAALGFGIFAGVAIGPGTAGSLATSAQQIIEMPSSGGGEQDEGGGGIASTESAAPAGGEEGGAFEEALPSLVPLSPEPVEPLPAPASEPAPKPASPDKQGESEEKPQGQLFEGTVVQANAPAGSYAIAIEGGDLISVHAAELPEPGTRVSASLSRLANGTFAEVEKVEPKKKPTSEAAFRGTVTFADPNPTTPAYTVSGPGVSLLVEVAPDPSGSAPTLPSIGSLVSVTAKVEKRTEPKAGFALVQKQIEVEPVPASTYLEMAAIAKEVVPAEGRLVLSADGAGESESALTLTIPSGIDATKLTVGDSYLATAEVAADGSLALKGIVGDERRKGADDSAGAQGDLKR